MTSKNSLPAAKTTLERAQNYLIAMICGHISGWPRSLWIGATWPCSQLYGAFIWARNQLQNRGLLPAESLDQRLISIGNITMGGSGKTPFTIMLAQLLATQYPELRAGVLLRGYQRAGGAQSLVVSDLKQIVAPVELSGDEAQLIAQRLPGTPVAVGQSRADSGRLLAKKCACELFLLDDAFSSRYLKRDLDIVMINGAIPFGNGHLIPTGNLREPLFELKRADILVINHCRQVANKAQLTRVLRRYNQAAPLIWTNPQAGQLYSPMGGQELPLTALCGQRVRLLTALAEPSSFIDTISAAAPASLDYQLFRDHQVLPEPDLRQAAADVLAGKLDYVVVTEKDAVKVKSWPSSGCYVLPITLKIESGAPELKAAIAGLLS